MHTSFRWPLFTTATLAILVAGWTSPSDAQTVSPTAKASRKTGPPVKDDGWISSPTETPGVTIRTRELTLYPKAAPQPALKYWLIPDDFHLLPGNAAIYYLKALGFLERDAARQRLVQTWKEAQAKAAKEGKPPSEVPPLVWLSTPPSELPLDEVKKYLQLTSFQPPLIRAAARRDRFDLDRNVRQIDDPLAYLLPDIQTLRQLARTQSLRCRVAIAEGRIDDAIAITGQQFALARHLGQDDFLVSNLVGVAIAGIAWNDALYLVQQRDTPNLYWALTTMPRPLVDICHSMAIERQLLYQEVKALREVNETPRSVGYWREFLDRMLQQSGSLAAELGLPRTKDNPKRAHAVLVGYIAAAYPGARDYLINECKLPRAQVEAYPIAQTVLLAVVRFYDRWRDEYFKWMYVRLWQARAKTAAPAKESPMFAASEKYGLCIAPALMLLPAIQAVRTAQARCGQTIALLRAVEGVRMYAAAHGGKLPPSLDALSVPPPIDPFTGKPIAYKLVGDHAILEGHSMPSLRYRLVLRIAGKR